MGPGGKAVGKPRPEGGAKADRYHVPGHLWHITHRCHKKEFLLSLESPVSVVGFAVFMVAVQRHGNGGDGR